MSATGHRTTRVQPARYAVAGSWNRRWGGWDSNPRLTDYEKSGPVHHALYEQQMTPGIALTALTTPDCLVRRSTNRSTPCPLPPSRKVTDPGSRDPASGRAELWSSQAVSRRVTFLPGSRGFRWPHLAAADAAAGELEAGVETDLRITTGTLRRSARAGCTDSTGKWHRWHGWHWRRWDYPAKRSTNLDLSRL